MKPAGRLLAILGLLLAGLILIPAGPAFACSCERPTPASVTAQSDFAFTGVVTGERVTDFQAVYTLDVDAVYRGAVHATQDVVTARQGPGTFSSCDVTLRDGEEWFVVGPLDEQGRLSVTMCAGLTSASDPYWKRLASAFGAGATPEPGADLVAVEEEPPWDWQRWFQLGIGVIGLAGISVLARRWWRSR